MRLTGLHLLLTYQCTFECDHCFVWGSPRQSGVMTLPDIRLFLKQARDLGAVSSIYFEGGEPFLYYATLLKAVHEARQLGFEVGIVSNAYWATSLEDALENLRPLSGQIQDLSVSSDLFHWGEPTSRQVRNALSAAGQLGIPTGVIRIAQPETEGAAKGAGQLPPGESGIMYRGRAAAKLSGQIQSHPWELFAACPHEDLREPGRLHLDPFGNLHICQGIVLGNLFEKSLADICAFYDPDAHPVTGPLLAGGPAELVRRYNIPHREAYADACHLCDEARRQLRSRFSNLLGPDQMYGA